MLHLAVQASVPFFSRGAAPPWINWGALLLATTSWWWLHRSGDRRKRAAARIAAVALAYLLFITSFFNQPSLEHLASVLSAELSRTLFGIPIFGLFAGWGVLAAGFLAGEALLCGLEEWVARKGTALRSIAALLCLAICIFGERAVIGYVSGATDLLP